MMRINLRKTEKAGRPTWAYTATAFLLALLVGSLSRAEFFIISGDEAKTGEFPGVVLIELNEGASFGADGWEGSCTGFLVHPKLILTAAHCLQNRTVRSISNPPHEKGKHATKFKDSESNSHPDFVLPAVGQTSAQLLKSAANDIGYIVLKEEIPATEIAPMPMYVTSDNPSMEKLNSLAATLVGYGATKWESSKNYEHSRVGIKNIGHKPITGTRFGSIVLDGENGGALPGDSGGPILAEVDGVQKVVAIDHAMTPGKKTVTRTDRRGRTKTVEVDTYGSTIGTMLTKANLCWVESKAKIDLAGVDCTPVKPAAK